jgi:hypothetical protein
VEDRNHQLSDRLVGDPAGGRSQQLPLRDEVAEEAVIRRVATWLDRVVRALRIRSRAQFMRRARQRVQAWPTQCHNRVARDHGGEQEMSNDSRHRNIVDDEYKVPLNQFDQLLVDRQYPPSHR